MLELLYYNPLLLILLFAVLAVWEAIWKGLGLWHSARNKQLVWFICILIFNTLGILPIIYLLCCRPREKKVKTTKSNRKK